MEVWKVIEGTDGRYEISSLGRVFDNDAVRFLSQSNTCRNRKYKVVLIHDKRIYVHRLVASAFIPNTLNKPYVNHIDGNPSNNSVENLEWCTQSENLKHAFKIGTKKPMRGGNSPRCSTMNEELVKKIASLKDNMSVLEIAKTLDLPRNHVSNIINGLSWNWLTGIDKYQRKSKAA